MRIGERRQQVINKKAFECSHSRFFWVLEGDVEMGFPSHHKASAFYDHVSSIKVNLV